MVQWIQDTASGLSILFDSDTDALVASAYLEDDLLGEVMDGFLRIVNKDGFDPQEATQTSFSALLPQSLPDRDEITNALLKIVHDPLFDVNDLTIRRSEEIDTRISEGRANATIPTYGHSAGIPMVVLQAVMDIFEREYCRNVFGPGALRLLFPSEPLEANEELASPRPDRYWQHPDHKHPMPDLSFGNVLLSMSTVHRTWTKVAQMALRRHVFIRSGSKLASFLRNPHCGPWIRSLWISSSCHFHVDRPTEEREMDWIPARHLASLFSRAPNIIHLVVTIHPRVPFTDLDTQQTLNVQSLLIALENQRLRDLSVLEFVCNAIPRNSMLHLLRRICDFDKLSSLTFLCRVHSTDGEAASEQRGTPTDSTSLDNLTPPRLLRSLSISLNSDELQLETVKWFIRPRDGYAPENIHFDLTVSLSPEKNEIQDHLVPCDTVVPSLQRFSIGVSQLHSTRPTPSTSIEKKHILETLFPHIRCFHLGPVSTETISPFLRGGMHLPASVEKLEIVFRADRMNYRNCVKWDVDLSALIMEGRLPSLREVNLLFSRVRSPDENFRTPFVAKERFPLLFGMCLSGRSSLTIQARHYDDVVNYNDSVQTFFLELS